MKRILALSFSIAAFSLLSCSSDETSQPNQSGMTSFGRLQQKVLTRSCAISGCHVAGAQFAAESGLILTADVAYENLFGVAAKQEYAAQNGLLRVKPGNPDSSFFYLKLGTVLDQNYGSKMPLGGMPLTVGQREFIRRWIAAGASKTTDDIDPSLLDDTTQPPLETFTPLDPPAPGTGYQLKIDQFQVSPQFERELFVYRRVGNTEPIYINRIQTKMRPGSHHFVFYTFEGIPPSVIPNYDEVRDLRLPNGSIVNTEPMYYHVYFGGTQMGGDVDYRFPPGVALALSADASLDLNTHYINHTFAPFPGECYANLYTTPASEVEHEANTLNLGNYDFSIPAGERTTVRTVFPNREPLPLKIIMLTSHTHEWMEQFVIKIQGGPRNGEIVYESANWGHPGVKYYDPPIVINTGEALVSEVTYNNTTNRTIEFGLKSTDEMDIIFGYYYY